MRPRAIAGRPPLPIIGFRAPRVPPRQPLACALQHIITEKRALHFRILEIISKTLIFKC
jgi:hypothetical protein